MKKELTQARLKELLNYNQETSLFTWLVSVGSRGKAMRDAGVTDSAAPADGGDV